MDKYLGSIISEVAKKIENKVDNFPLAKSTHNGRYKATVESWLIRRSVKSIKALILFTDIFLLVLKGIKGSLS